MTDEPQPDPVIEGELVEDGPVAPPAAADPATGGVTAPPDTGYTSSGVPTFDAVREKIETRYGTSLGATELAAETEEGRAVEEQYEARQRAAAERLAQIRATMHPDDGTTNR